MTSERELKQLYHDLQSPLAVIQGFFRLLDGTIQRERSFNDDQRALYEAARASLEKVKNLLNQLS